MYHVLKATILVINWVARHLFGIDFQAESNAMTLGGELDNISR
jgi:hypothetical protein